VIILDTNVLSALMQKVPERAVVHWLDQQAVESIWITSITLFEVRLGLALLPAGRRRDALERALSQVLEEELGNRVLEFDTAAAAEAAALAAIRRRSGRSVDFRDTQIAGIALSRRARIATRNIKHFQDLDVPVIDPWASTLRA
jgi:toxin FitB